MSTSAPVMTRMADGRMVPAQTSFNGNSTRRNKLLVVIQYYDGDKDQAEALGTLIADLERIRNRNADILIFGRSDAAEFDPSVVAKLSSKFDKVTFARCRRKGSRSYPYGPNEMFYDLVTSLGQSPWTEDYLAFLNLEADCTPLHPGWINELLLAFKDAKAHGFSALGHIHDNPTPHMNGVAVYDTEIWKIVGSGKLNGGSPNIAFDIDHATDLLPHAVDTAYVMLDFKRPTILPEDLFKPQKGSNVEPAIYHGVKDNTAREAVRAKHITFTPVNAAAQRTVFTYSAMDGHMGINEHQSTLSFWREGWISRGWNPVVLTPRDASGNGRYAELVARLKQIPNVRVDQFVRWLALDNLGGGLLVDSDVLPGRLTPADLVKFNTVAAFVSDTDSSLCAARFDRANVRKWVDALLTFEVQPGETKTTDRTVFDRVYNADVDTFRFPLTVPYGETSWRDAPMVHFSNSALAKSGVRGERKSVAMERYLRGE